MKLLAYLGKIEHEVDVEPTEGGYTVTVGDATHLVDCAVLESAFYSLIIEGRSYEISVREGLHDNYIVRHGAHKRVVKILDPMTAVGGAHVAGGGKATVHAIMPGRVVKVLVEEGVEVAEGQGMIVLEAMKMENEVVAPRDGKVSKLFVAVGQTLETGEKIAEIE